MIAVSFAALGTAHAATSNGTWYFSPSGLPSGASWSVKIYDVTDGYTVTTVSGSGTLSYTSTAGGAVQLVADPQQYTQSESTVDGSYTTNFGTPGEQTMTSPTTFTFTYSNTLFYSWYSTGQLPTSFGVNWHDTLGGSYGSSVSGSDGYSNVLIGSSSSSPSLPVGNGYPFIWGLTVPSGYSASPNSGTFTSTGSTTITFALVTYTDTFTESGLPSGTLWGITLSNGTSYKTTGTSLSVNFNVDTQYTYTVQGVGGYTITSGSTGTLASGSTSITYSTIPYSDTFSETGLKSGTSWGVYANNTWHYSTSNLVTISYNVADPLNYTIQTVDNYSTPSPQTGNLTTSSNIAVTYSPITYYTYFNETGLNTGTIWTVVFNSHAFSSSTSSIRVPWNVVNSSGYTVSKVNGYLTPSPSAGTLNSLATRDISFVKIAGTVNYTETGLPNGTTWGMNFNGTQKYATAGSTISFSEPTGTFISTPSTNDSHWYSPFYNNNQNYLYDFPIALSGVPSGSGYYQQLITISNPSHYGINSNGSNILFTASNGTKLYAWEQSVNSSAIQVWIKNFNGSSQINMQVYPEFESLFSANGYLGYGREYFNAQEIFVFATDFNSLAKMHLSDDSYYPASNNAFITTAGLTYYTGSSGSFALVLTNQSFNGNLYAMASGTFGASGANDFTVGPYNGLTQSGSTEWIHGGFLGYYSPSSQGYQSSSGSSPQNGSASSPYFSLSPQVGTQWINSTSATTWVDNSHAYTVNLGAYSSTDYYGVEFGSHQTMNVTVSYLALSILSPSQMPIASISSYSVSVTGNATYNIQFSQYRITTHFDATGLDLGTSFYVNATSSNQNISGIDSTGINITQANLTNITYFYGTATGWFVPTGSGGTVETLANLTITVGFEGDKFAVSFVETGLPAGTTWHIYIGNVEYSSATNTIVITTSGGYLSVINSAGSNYSSSAWSGYVGNNMTVKFSFTSHSTNYLQNGENYLGLSIIIGIFLVIAAVAIFYIMKVRSQGRGR